MSSNRIDTLIYTLRQNDHLVSHISTTRFSRNFLSCFPSTFLTISREPVYFPCTLSHFSIVRDFLELSLGASFSRNFQVSSLLISPFSRFFRPCGNRGNARATVHVRTNSFRLLPIFLFPTIYFLQPTRVHLRVCSFPRSV